MPPMSNCPQERVSNTMIKSEVLGSVAGFLRVSGPLPNAQKKAYLAGSRYKLRKRDKGKNKIQNYRDLFF